MTHPDEEQENQWWLVGAAGLAVFMASVDMSIVTAALPAIERDLGLSTSAVEWIVLAYLLPLAGLALPSARWLDSVGRRPALLLSLAGFAVASLAAGLAPTLGWLIGARLLQGSFGAVLFALVPALATTAVRPRARGRAMGLITTLGPLGLVSGPVIGGRLVDGPGWPWIFFVNVPVSLLVLLVGLRLLAPDRPLRVPERTWFLEAALLTVAVAGLLLALTLTADVGPAWLLLVVVVAPLLGGWLRHPVSRPVRRLLAVPGVGGPHVALTGAATAIGVVFFIVPFFLQRALGESATTAGVVLLAFPVGMALAGPVGGVLGDAWGWRRTALLGVVLFTAGLLLLAPMDQSWEAGDVAWRLFAAGCGNGLFNAPNMARAMSCAPSTLLATAGATTSLARQVGFALGPALAGLMWALASYRLDAMTVPVLLAAGCSAVSAAALVGPVRHPGPLRMRPGRAPGPNPPREPGPVGGRRSEQP